MLTQSKSYSFPEDEQQFMQDYIFLVGISTYYDVPIIYKKYHLENAADIIVKLHKGEYVSIEVYSSISPYKMDMPVLNWD